MTPMQSLVESEPITKATNVAVDGTNQPEADNGHEYSMPAPNARTAEEFSKGVIGPASLSVAVSKLAVHKATDADTKQFANFELREAIAVVGILTSMNTLVPPMTAAGEALLIQLENSAGKIFDQAYMGAQLANHEFLRDLAESYLSNSTGPADPEEIHGRHLAALAITAFKEHVVLAKNISRALEA
jgi:putative membrane protein